MCGIVGIFTSTHRPVDRSLLERMNTLLTHRGPDSAGYRLDRHVGLAMRRLKVIDLATGDQPIHDGTKSHWIVFNGEIYNYRELRAALEKKGHRFYTHSDTEVILHQYMEEGEDCVRSLAGMFAFAIYDSRDDSLFMARDRLGIKPFFYHQDSSGLVFASEIKSILAVPWVRKELDPQAVSDYFSLNYLPPPLTPLKNILQLPPGHTARYREGQLTLGQYWDVPIGHELDISEDEAVRTASQLMHRSIERRLIADVPVGAFLSGGMDSSSLVSLMKEHKHDQINTFSVGFSEASYDETPYAREVARYFGTNHHEIVCRPEDVRSILPKIAWHADGLLADQACVPLFMVSELAKRHVTVALSGDGGDEVFVGYKTFHADYHHALYSRLPKFLRHQIIDRFVRGLPVSTQKLSFEYLLKKFVEAGDFSPEKAHYWWRTIFSDREKSDLLTPAVLKGVTDLDASKLYLRYLTGAGSDLIPRALYADLKVWLAGNNLCKVDSMTMAHGLEARVPFLDHELVEFMSRVPVRIKFRGRKLKCLLKKTMAGRLPDAVLHRAKAGWHMPIGRWLQGSLFDSVGLTILKKNPSFESVVNLSRAKDLLNEHRAGKYNHTFKLWGLLIFWHWTDQFMNQSAEAI